MRAAFHLPACDFGGFLPLFRGDEFFELARADHVGAFADDQGPRAFLCFDHVDAAVDGPMARTRRVAGDFLFRHLSDGANVFLRGSTAAADDIQPAALDKAIELLSESGGSLLVQPLFVRKASIWVAGNEPICQGLQRTDVVGHEFGPGGAIQP
jgi:hypothetical protein